MTISTQKLRENIQRNAERSNRQWQREHKTEAPESVKNYHRQMLENAETARERAQNNKRGV